MSGGDDDQDVPLARSTTKMGFGGAGANRGGGLGMRGGGGSMNGGDRQGTRLMGNGSGGDVGGGSGGGMLRGNDRRGNRAWVGGRGRRGGAGYTQGSFGGPNRKVQRMDGQHLNSGYRKGSAGSSGGVSYDKRSRGSAGAHESTECVLKSVVTPMYEEEGRRKPNTMTVADRKEVVETRDVGLRTRNASAGLPLELSNSFDSIGEQERLGTRKRGHGGWVAENVTRQVGVIWDRLEGVGVNLAWDQFEAKTMRDNMVAVPRIRFLTDGSNRVMRWAGSTMVRHQAHKMAGVAGYWRLEDAVQDNVNTSENVTRGFEALFEKPDSNNVKLLTEAEGGFSVSEAGQVLMDNAMAEYVKRDSCLGEDVPKGIGLYDKEEPEDGTQLAPNATFVRTPLTGAGGLLGDSDECKFTASVPNPVFVNKAVAMAWSAVCDKWMVNGVDTRMEGHERQYETTKTILQQRANCRAAAPTIESVKLAPTELACLQYVGALMAKHPQNFGALLLDAGAERGVAVLHAVCRDLMVQYYQCGVLSYQHPLKHMPGLKAPLLNDAIWRKLVGELKKLPDAVRERKTHVGAYELSRAGDGRLDVVLKESTAMTFGEEIGLLEGQLTSDEMLIKGRYRDAVANELSGMPVRDYMLRDMSMWDFVNNGEQFGDIVAMRQSLHLLCMQEELCMDREWAMVAYCVSLVVKELSEVVEVTDWSKMDGHARRPLLPMYTQKTPLVAVPNWPDESMTNEAFLMSEHAGRGTCVEALFAGAEKLCAFRGYLMLIVMQADLYYSRDKIREFCGRFKLMMRDIQVVMKEATEVDGGEREKALARNVADEVVEDLCRSMVLIGDSSFSKVDLARNLRYGKAGKIVKQVYADAAVVEEMKGVELGGYRRKEQGMLTRAEAEWMAPLDKPKDDRLVDKLSDTDIAVREALLRGNTTMSTAFFDVMNGAEVDTKDQSQVEGLLRGVLAMTGKLGHKYLTLKYLDKLLAKNAQGEHANTFMEALGGKVVRLKLGGKSCISGLRAGRKVVEEHMKDLMHMLEGESDMTDEFRATEFLWAALPWALVESEQPCPLSMTGAVFAMKCGANSFVQMRAQWIHMVGQWVTGYEFREAVRDGKGLRKEEFDTRVMMIPAEQVPEGGATLEGYAGTLTPVRSAKARRAASRMARASLFRAKECNMLPSKAGVVDPDQGELMVAGMAGLCAGLANIVALTRNAECRQNVWHMLWRLEHVVYRWQWATHNTMCVDLTVEAMVCMVKLHEVMRDAHAIVDQMIGLRVVGESHAEVVTVAKAIEYVKAYLRSELSVEYWYPYGVRQPMVDGRMTVNVRYAPKGAETDKAWSELNAVQHKCIGLMPKEVVMFCQVLDSKLFSKQEMEYSQLTIATMCKELDDFQATLEPDAKEQKLREVSEIVLKFAKGRQTEEFVNKINANPLRAGMDTVTTVLEGRKEANVGMDQFMREAPLMGPVFSLIVCLEHQPRACLGTAVCLMDEAVMCRVGPELWTPAVRKALAVIKQVRDAYELEVDEFYNLQQCERTYYGAMWTAYKEGKIGVKAMMDLVHCLRLEWSEGMFLDEDAYVEWEKQVAMEEQARMAQVVAKTDERGVVDAVGEEPVNKDWLAFDEDDGGLDDSADVLMLGGSVAPGGGPAQSKE